METIDTNIKLNVPAENNQQNTTSNGPVLNDAAKKLEERMQNIINEEPVSLSQMMPGSQSHPSYTNPQIAFQQSSAPATQEFDSSDPMSALMKGAAAVEQQSQELREKINTNIELSAVPNMLEDAGEDGKSPIEDLLSEIDDNEKKKQLDMTENDDLELLLQKLESEKAFAVIKSAEEKTGPADYIVELNADYVQAVEDICEGNSIRVIKRSATERNAILERFTNSGPEVSMVMANSGLFIKSSGAGPSEIIAMNQIRANSAAATELNKLAHVSQHITGSTIGRLELNKLIKVISYYDKDSLYYALYAGTYPDKSELSRQCEKCGAEFYMMTNTYDLLLNPEEFEGRAEYIRNDVTSFDELIKASQLGHIYSKRHSSGMIIYYKHPSIESYVSTLKNLRPEVINKYNHLVDMAYGIDKVAIPDANGGFITYSDPNEIIVIISKLRNVQEKYEILDMLQEVRPHSIPVYGFKEATCPHCGTHNQPQSFPMEQLLFMKAQREEEMAAFRWAAKTQKLNKGKSKKK